MGTPLDLRHLRSIFSASVACSIKRRLGKRVVSRESKKRHSWRL